MEYIGLADITATKPAFYLNVGLNANTACAQ